MFATITQWDIGILHWISENLTNPFLDAVMPFITSLADKGWFWIALALVLIAIPKTRWIGLTMGVALAFGVILGNGVIKNVVHRIRPYDFDPTLIVRITKLPDDFSFPSGHTLASMEAATALFLRNKKAGIPALVLAVLISLSRLYVAVHYPTDVIVGAVLGVFFAFAAKWVIDAVRPKCEARFPKLFPKSR